MTGTVVRRVAAAPSCRRGQFYEFDPENWYAPANVAGADPNSRVQLDVIAPQELLSTPEDARAMLSKAAEAVRPVFGSGPLPAHGPWVHVYTIPFDQWAQDGRVPDWEGFRALLRAETPEKADEALALIYGPGRHTAAAWRRSNQPYLSSPTTDWRPTESARNPPIIVQL